jgi:5'-nucleotidase
MASTQPGSSGAVDAARTAGEPVIVARPGRSRESAMQSHGTKGVRIEPRGENRFAVHGTPADCTRLGLLHAVPDAKWVLSGINHGANLGADVYYSGTVAAVREAVLHGWPGHRVLALSESRAWNTTGHAPLGG